MSGFTQENLSSCVLSVENATTPEATLGDTLVIEVCKQVVESGTFGVPMFVTFFDL